MHDFFVNNNMGAISLLSPNVHTLGVLSFTSHLSKMVAQMVRNLPAMWEIWVQSLGWEDSPGEGKVYPLQYSGLRNSWTV